MGCQLAMPIANLLRFFYLFNGGINLLMGYACDKKLGYACGFTQRCNTAPLRGYYRV
jgi:hypothetical protein